MIEEWMQSAARSPQGSPYGGVALGHAPQQPNTGMGPNRYIPPTFNYSTNTPTGRPNYQQMDWNQVQQFYTPNNNSQGQMTNGYMQQLQSMLGQFGQQYGGPNRRPTMPNFSSYNPGFGGPTSYYDQQRGRAGRDGYDSIGDMGTIYDSGQQRDPNDMSLAGPRRGYMEGGQMRYMDGRVGPDGRVQGRNSNNEWGSDGAGINYNLAQGEEEMSRIGRGGSYEDFVSGFSPTASGMGGNMYYTADGIGGNGGRGMYSDFGNSMGGYGGGRGGYGGQMGMMPQFNPYMMMQNSMRGMDFNQMFDPRFASLFGGNSFGSRTPNSQQPGAGGAGPAADLIGNTKPMQGGGG